MVYVFVLFLCMISQFFVASDDNVIEVERAKVAGVVIESPRDIALLSPVFRENEKFGFDIDGLERVKSPVFLRSIVAAKKTVFLEEARTMVDMVITSHASLNYDGARRLAQIAIFVSKDRNVAVSKLEAVYSHLLRHRAVSSWDLHCVRKEIGELRK